MSTLKLAVLKQVAYAHSVRGFIREILKALIPGKWIDRVISDSDATFDAKLDAAFASIDEFAATKDDYCRKVVNVLCDEMARLCEVLREVCEGCGYGDYARCYISHEKFVRLLLRTDTVKLGRLKKALAAHGNGPADLLRGIGAILDDRPLEETAALADAERRRANTEIRRIAKDVKKSIAKIDAVGEQVAALDEKVSEIGTNKSGRRSRKAHSREKVAAVRTAWAVYIASATARMSVNTRPTNSGAFEYSRRQLELAGVTTLKEFSEIKHSIRTQEYRARLKEFSEIKHSIRTQEYRARLKALEAKRGGAAPTKRGRNGIIPTVRKNAKTAILALAFAGASLAAPLRPDASPDALRGGGGQTLRIAA